MNELKTISIDKNREDVWIWLGYSSSTYSIKFSYATLLPCTNVQPQVNFNFDSLWKTKALPST